jgi:hypothetical protein
MGEDLFILFTPFLYIAMGLYILIKLQRINKILNMWELDSLSLIPIIFILLYSWIGFISPIIEYARLGNRVAVAFSLTIACHVLYACSKNMFNKGVK